MVPPEEDLRQPGEDLRHVIVANRRERMFNELIQLLEDSEDGECVRGRALELARALKEM